MTRNAVIGLGVAGAAALGGVVWMVTRKKPSQAASSAANSTATTSTTSASSNAPSSTTASGTTGTGSGSASTTTATSPYGSDPNKPPNCGTGYVAILHPEYGWVCQETVAQEAANFKQAVTTGGANGLGISLGSNYTLTNAQKAAAILTAQGGATYQVYQQQSGTGGFYVLTPARAAQVNAEGGQLNLIATQYSIVRSGVTAQTTVSSTGTVPAITSANPNIAKIADLRAQASNLQASLAALQAKASSVYGSALARAQYDQAHNITSDFTLGALNSQYSALIGQEDQIRQQTAALDSQISALGG